MTEPMSVRAGRSGGPFAAGASVFAGTMMLVVGVLQVFEGLTALINGNDFLVRTGDYIFAFNASAWGWTHLILGLGVAAAGGFIFTGNIVARYVGIALAALSVIANFAWLPYYPLGGVVVIAFNVFIIWGLARADLSEV